jgi:hypothetical protein
MNVQPIDIRNELWQSLQSSFDLAPIVFCRPIARQFLHSRQLYALRPVIDRLPIRPSRGGDASATHADAQDLITYFNRICDDVERYKKRLDEYRDEIERDMPGVENGLYEQIRTLRDRHLGSSGGNGDSVSDQLGQVLLALREMGTAIVNQAGQIADTRERLSRLQAGILDTGIYGTTIAA